MVCRMEISWISLAGCTSKEHGCRDNRCQRQVIKSGVKRDSVLVHSMCLLIRVCRLWTVHLLEIGAVNIDYSRILELGTWSRSGDEAKCEKGGVRKAYPTEPRYQIKAAFYFKWLRKYRLKIKSTPIIVFLIIIKRWVFLSQNISFKY